jgi:hypothetical protein
MPTQKKDAGFAPAEKGVQAIISRGPSIDQAMQDDSTRAPFRR